MTNGLTRRRFLHTSFGSAGLALSSNSFARALFDDNKPRAKLPVAAVVTVYHKNSHADVIVGKVLEGWTQDGGLGPDLKLVSMYVDQVGANDLSAALSQKHGFQIAKSIDDVIKN